MFNELKDANQTEMRFIIKRSGKQTPYEPIKIRNAITKANNEEAREDKKMSQEQIKEIVNILTSIVFHSSRALSVEEIQDIVEAEICKRSYSVFLLYHDYRFLHNQKREMNGLDKKIQGIVEFSVDKETGQVSVQNEEVKQENSNKNPTILSVQRDYMAGEWSRYYTNKYLLPGDILKAHEEGIIHFHDSDFFAQKMHNCCLVNLEDMLQNGTCMSGTKIDKPKSFSTASTVASQIVAAVASSQYGGQTISLSHLAPFVDISRQKIRARLKKEFEDACIEITKDSINQIAEKELLKEIEAGCQTLQYQLITLHSTNGQAPFVTVFMYLNEAEEGQTKDDLALLIQTMLKQRILGVKDGSGTYITPAFPKLIYVLQEDNIKEGTKYWELTKLAAECTAKRMVPDYISEKKMFELKGDVYPCMGCRSFLTPDRFTDKGIGNIANAMNYKEGQHKYYGRFNQGVCTLNLVDIACSSGKNEEKFWKIMNERLELCHRALRIRHERLLGTPSDVAPIMWQDGALARLKPGETIDKLLYDGFSTISLGYAGLAECVRYMKDTSHTSKEGKVFGLAVMQTLNDACARWKTAENIDYSVYGTPIESTTYKFAKTLQRRFGIIEGVTDKNYITNSYHIHVTEEIDAFEKLSKEAEFQALSPGGAISYVEVPNMTNNIEAVLTLMQHIYDTILYAELNTKLDTCEACGYEGQIQIVEKNGKLVWKCPQCGCEDESKMHVARRTCGKPSYIATVQNDRNSREIRPEKADNLELSLTKNCCDVCGRHQKHIIKYYGQKLCNKHYRQIKKYGHVLDNNPRTIYDKNEFHIKGEITYIDLYDQHCNKIAETLIDTEDLNKVKHTKWKLSSSGYAMNNPKYKGSNLHMSRVILDTTKFVDHINHNTLDNRKSNLRIVTKSQNQMNTNYKGVSKTKDSKYYAHIKINQKMINLGVYIFEEEALFARWYAETILFKEYQYPKQKPVILKDRENQIISYVQNKIKKTN